MIVDQTTRAKETRRCLDCRLEIEHVQCVKFTPMKLYVYLPRRHHRPDGSLCGNLIQLKGERP